jgi:hypothetical protein
VPGRQPRFRAAWHPGRSSIAGVLRSDGRRSYRIGRPHSREGEAVGATCQEKRAAGDEGIPNRLGVTSKRIAGEIMFDRCSGP